MPAALAALAVLRLGLTLELGPEFDSNANRAEVLNLQQGGPTPVASFLVAGAADGSLLLAGEKNLLRLRLHAGGKLFFAEAATPQDVAVVHGSVDDALHLGRVTLGIAGEYYDAWQWIDCKDSSDSSCHRDFRSLEARPSLAVRAGPFALTAGAGGRLFTWKPDEAFSFAAPHVFGAIALRWTSGSDGENEWTLSTSGRMEWRYYVGPALVAADDPGSALEPRRFDRDLFWTVGLNFAGDLLGGAFYSLDDDRSNSFGQSFLRHIVGFSLGFELPGQVVATLRAQLVFANYPQGQVVLTGEGAPRSIEDENRNAVLVDLARSVGRFTFFLRYSLFQNGVSNALVSYERHLVYLGATLRAW